MATVVSGQVEFANLTFTGETTMTKHSIALEELAEKGPDADLLRHIQCVAYDHCQMAVIDCQVLMLLM